MYNFDDFYSVIYMFFRMGRRVEFQNSGQSEFRQPDKLPGPDRLSGGQDFKSPHTALHTAAHAEKHINHQLKIMKV